MRDQLDRVLSSEQFVRSERLGRLLRLIVESGLSGDVTGLKESVLGREVYDRGNAFDGRVDPIVRTEMRRLRRKLSEYYESSGLADPCVIEIPKGGYVPVFRARDTSRPRMEGESLGSYEVVEQLGSGPSGITYRVVEPSTGREFAAKQLSPDIAANPRAVAALKADVESTSALDSEHACGIEAVEETPDGMLLRSRYCEGVTLEERLFSVGLQWPDSQSIAAQLLDGLAAAHRRGVAHGHLKPSDILLSEGVDIQVTILNFGTRPLAGRVVMTPDGTSVGTTGYAQSHGAAGPASDVRSAGAILYQLFTASLPVPDASRSPHAIQFVPDVPFEHRRDLANLIGQCLAPDPRDRFADAIELARAYTRVFDRPPRRVRGWSIPTKTAIAVLVLAIVVAVLLAAAR